MITDAALTIPSTDPLSCPTPRRCPYYLPTPPPCTPPPRQQPATLSRGKYLWGEEGQIS